jgi:hypothetical protein
VRGVLVVAREAVGLELLASVSSRERVELLEERHQRMHAAHGARPVVGVVAELVAPLQPVVDERGEGLLDEGNHARAADLEEHVGAHRL